MPSVVEDDKLVCRGQTLPRVSTTITIQEPAETGLRIGLETVAPGFVSYLLLTTSPPPVRFEPSAFFSKIPG